MWGAIIGDLAGSIYEFAQTKNIKSIECIEIIPKNAFFSDDTILTIAILDAINTDKDYEKHLKKYFNLYKDYLPNYKPYFKNIFSPNFIKWASSDITGNSIGNGAMMRISPVGYLFDNIDDVVKNARLATVSSHNSKEAIWYATLVAKIIFYARCNIPKEEILKKLNLTLEYRPFKKFNTTCEETFNNCLYAVFTSNNFLESIKKVLSYGGDTDTNACITSSMAEAFYKINDELIKQAEEYIPDDFVRVLKLGYKNI